MQAETTVRLGESEQKSVYISSKRVSKVRALTIGFFAFILVRLFVIAFASFVALVQEADVQTLNALIVVLNTVLTVGSIYEYDRVRQRRLIPLAAIRTLIIAVLGCLATIVVAFVLTLVVNSALLENPNVILVVLAIFAYFWARSQLPQGLSLVGGLVTFAAAYVLSQVVVTPLLLTIQNADMFQMWSYMLALPVGVRAFFWSQTANEQTSLLLQTVLNLFRSRNAIIGMCIIALLILMGDFAPFVATHDPTLQLYGVEGDFAPLPRKPPCIPLFGCAEPQHLLGMDQNARDIFSRIIYGARTSLYVGIASVSLAIVSGTVLGLVSGYASGWIDNIIMRIMDVLLAFPGLLLAIAIVTVLGPGLQNALLAIAIVSIPAYARLARASTLSVKELEFVTAERALGANPSRILFGQILPNTLTPLIVQGTLGIGGAVLEAAALSFVGLGAQPPTPEWGQMLSEARSFVFTVPHMVFFPGIAIMITVLGFNLLGDGMRDALDPRLNRN